MTCAGSDLRVRWKAEESHNAQPGFYCPLRGGWIEQPGCHLAHGGKFDQHHSLQLMFARIEVQGITLVLLLIALVQSAR